ncbi:TRAP transporter large permease subunit [Rothia aerolata]|nr:TRAP transporter large permease subunit [Rothia aerolata]
MIGVWALIIYLVVIIGWCAVIKRSVGEAMILGFIAAILFAGKDILTVGWSSLYDALTDQIVYSTMIFVFMGFLLEKAGVMEKLINLLNSVLGGVKGGPAYVSTLASASLGSVVHNQAAISATVGAVTIPWMTRSNMDKGRAASLIAGNGGMGITFPFSASMFALVGSTTVSSILNVNDLIVPLIFGGLWCVLHRLIVTFIFVRQSRMEAESAENRMSFGPSFRQGWSTLSIFVGVGIPLLLTVGPLYRALSSWSGTDLSKEINIVLWIPVVLVLLGLLLGSKRLPRSPGGWKELILESVPRFTTVGITVLFGFAGANALATTGLSDQLTGLLSEMHLPLWLLAILVGVIVIAVAAPLSSTATMAAVGTVGVVTLVSAGVPAPTAAVATLIFSSCEAAVPPGGPPLYVACGIANVNPIQQFTRMMLYYALPLLAIGVLVILGVLPV